MFPYALARFHALITVQFIKENGQRRGLGYPTLAGSELSVSDTYITTDPPACQPTFLDPIPTIIPFGSVTVVAGASGAGKTILLSEWMQRLRDGRTICGHSTNAPTAIYHLAADRDWSTYKAAYAAAGYPDINYYCLAEDVGFDPRKWGKKKDALTLFEDCLNCLEPIPGSVVNVDPVAPIFIQGNQNDARDVALSLHWYRKMARKYQVTLILYANTAKRKQEDTYKRAQDRIAGSGAFVAYSDTQIAVEQDEDRIMTMCWTPRRAPSGEFRFQFDTGSSLFVPYVPTTRVEIPEANAALFALIPEGEGGITSPELIRQAVNKLQTSRSAIFRALKALDTEHKLIDRSSHGLITRRAPKVPTPTVNTDTGETGTIPPN